MRNYSRKTIRRLLISLIIAILFAVVEPVIIDSRSLAHAISEWRANPSPTTEAVVRHWQDEVRKEELRIRTLTAVVLFAVIASVWFTIAEVAERHRERLSSSSK